jgi:serine protease Do
MVRNVTDQMIHGGKVSRAFLGVMIQPVTPDIAKAFKLNKAEGALIADVTSGSPAERAGLRAGDVVTKIDERSVGDSRALQLMVAELVPGRNVRLTVVRNGSEKQYPVTLGEQPSDRSESSNSEHRISAERNLDGVSLEAARNMTGVAVRRIDPDSRAAEAGLQQGDVLLEVNRQPVSSVDQLNRFIRQGAGESVLLFVNHDGRTRYVVVPLS